MKKKLVAWLTVMVAMSMSLAVTAPAQPDPEGDPEGANAVCFEELSSDAPLVPGFSCVSLIPGDFDPLSCPTGDRPLEGEILSCSDYSTEAPFDCLVLRADDLSNPERGDYVMLWALCTPGEEPPEPPPEPQLPEDSQPRSLDEGGDGSDGGGGHGGGGGATPITQEGQQNSEAGEIDQAFDIS